MEKLGWDNYNEGTTLQKSAEKYKQRFGCYPEAYLQTKYIVTGKTRQFCKEKGIRLSGPALEFPSKEKAQVQKQLFKLYAAERNAIYVNVNDKMYIFNCLRMYNFVNETVES